MNETHYSIAAVERDTGLSKDVLRVWERRYGFPTPERDIHGERVYPESQLVRLRQIKRLMDQGHRPGKLIASDPGSLDALASKPPRKKRFAAPPAGTISGDDLPILLDMIRRHDAVDFQQALQGRLARDGLLHFVQDTVAPLSVLVGQEWEQGRFEIYEEHLFTELTKRLLRQAIGSLPAHANGLRVLLTTVPEERHVLGLLMVEAVLVAEGAHCIPLGTQMPLLDIARAAEVHRADVVALSFSGAYPHRQVTRLITQLADNLPPHVELWAGGSGVARLSDNGRVRILHSLEDARHALLSRSNEIKNLDRDIS